MRGEGQSEGNIKVWKGLYESVKREACGRRRLRGKVEKFCVENEKVAKYWRKINN